MLSIFSDLSRRTRANGRWRANLAQAARGAFLGYSSACNSLPSAAQTSTVVKMPITL